MRRDRYINGKIISGVIKELYRVSLLGWVTGQSGWIKSIDVQH